MGQGARDYPLGVRVIACHPNANDTGICRCVTADASSPYIIDGGAGHPGGRQIASTSIITAESESDETQEFFVTQRLGPWARLITFRLTCNEEYV